VNTEHDHVATYSRELYRINISVRGAERRYLSPDFFVSCRILFQKRPNKPNFIDFGDGTQLKNYRFILFIKIIDKN